MCSRAGVVLALALLARGGTAVAQRTAAAAADDAGDRALLARADSLYAELQARRAAQRASRRAQLEAADGVSVLFWEAVPRTVRQVLVADGAAMLREFGAVPDSFARNSVVVQVWATDTAAVLDAPAFRDSRRIGMEWPQPSDTTNVRWRIAASIAAEYRETLDAAWRTWLPVDYGIAWKREREGGAAMRSLTQDVTFGGRECLAGKMAECRRWLGLDPDEHPYATRYRAEELRRMTRERWFGTSNADRSACLGGSDDACLRFVEERRWLSLIPAPDAARAAMIRAVHALHGAPAVQAALADTAGGVGARFAQAAGVSEDSLVAEWRVWVLSGGRPQRVTASAGDALPIMLLAGLALLLASRSGRWR